MKYLLALFLVLGASSIRAQDTCKTYSHKNPHGAAMTISRVWILDSVNFTVRPIQTLPYQESATGSFDFEVCIIPRDGKKYSTQVRYQTTHGPVSYNISNFVAPTGTSGVSEVAVEEQAEVYPNPTPDVVNVLLDYPFEYSVTSPSGTTILTGSGDKTIDLRALPSGSYFLYLRSTGRPDVMTRIIKR